MFLRSAAVLFAAVIFACALPARLLAEQPNKDAANACVLSIDPVLGSTPLRSVQQARRRGTVRILAIGSSSTSGVGASSASASYPAMAQAALRHMWPDTQIQVINRGIPGETGVAAAKRMRAEVDRHRPDLVLWQVGTNGALAGIPIDVFRKAIEAALGDIRQRELDVILIDPQYVAKFKHHTHYGRVVDMLAAIANDKSVGLVRRYAAMRDLAKRQSLSAYLARDAFHMNDRGYRCLATYVVQAIKGR